jgi:DNA sulfur modification protein DndD
VALGDAVKALLGLDLAERLVADSTVLEGRLAKKIKKSDDLEALTKLEESWREKKANVERLKQDRAGIVPQLERAQSRAQKAEANFAKVGGKHWEQREQRTQQKGELQTTVQHCEDPHGHPAMEYPLPLGLVLVVKREDAADADRYSGRQQCRNDMAGVRRGA